MNFIVKGTGSRNLNLGSRQHRYKKHKSINSAKLKCFIIKGQMFNLKYFILKNSFYTNFLSDQLTFSCWVTGTHFWRSSVVFTSTCSWFLLRFRIIRRFCRTLIPPPSCWWRWVEPGFGSCWFPRCVRSGSSRPGWCGCCPGWTWSEEVSVKETFEFLDETSEFGSFVKDRFHSSSSSSSSWA